MSKKNLFNLFYHESGVGVCVGGLRELVEAEVGPLVLLLLHALALRAVIGLGVGQLRHRHRDVLLGKLLPLPRVLHNLQEATVHLKLQRKSGSPNLIGFGYPNKMSPWHI